jgi:hypothetical protein
MLETLTIITLTTIFLLIFRPGTTPPLDNPLVIERPGSHHILLASKLNLAQPFIEVVAQALMADNGGKCSATQYFEIRDKQVKVPGSDCYLLAATERNGLRYFQGIGPAKDAGHLVAITKFAEGVLLRYPASGAYDAKLDERIVAAVQDVAAARGIEVRQLRA